MANPTAKRCIRSLFSLLGQHSLLVGTGYCIDSLLKSDPPSNRGLHLLGKELSAENMFLTVRLEGVSEPLYSGSPTFHTAHGCC